MAVGGYDGSADIGSARHPAVITGAAESFEDQHRARVRRYTIIMAFRIPALVLAAIAYSTFGNPWIAIAIIAASIPLPWVAVLVANDSPPRKKGEPRLYAARTPDAALPHERAAIEADPHPIIDGSIADR
ncbi:DUF3099 domain-containing protein [Antrihabitans sp. YC2-6]|uniref:DUF3099 domain-containing protein n=1 Tax=Antrihabitans sp. YC2-6 TaxID=2799498 RepID=UPI0018F4C937|nr:DUF3099 domain-containing protein [Antrihabitans sp. YC2-6]MBJ8345054.1 DUF3099 domain-containing protein [Antrihabitans sp. YC2-6]